MKIPTIVTSSSGPGKTYVINELQRIMPEFDIFDPDNLRGIIDYDDMSLSMVQMIRTQALNVAQEL